MKKSSIKLYLIAILIINASVVRIAYSVELPAPKPSMLIHSNPYFSKFVKQVWRSNAHIQSAQTKVESAKYELKQSSKPLYNPNIDLEGQYVFKGEREDTYTAGISQTIDLFNKRRAHAEVGHYGFVEANANLQEQKLLIASEALKSLTAYRVDESVVMLAKRRTQLLHRFVLESERKFKAGDIAQSEIDQARLAYTEAISQQADEEVLLTQARQRLISVSQMNTLNWLKLPNKLPLPVYASSFIRSQWLRQLPIIRFYDAQVEVAQSAAHVAAKEAKPDPTINVRSGVEDKEPLVRFGLSMPLYVRNNYSDQVQAVNRQAIATDQDRMNAYKTSNAALNESLIRYQVLYKASLKFDSASKDNFVGGIKLLNKLWSAGEINTTDYIIQLKQRINSQIDGVKLKGHAWDTWFSLMEYSGQMTTWLSIHDSRSTL